MIGKMIFDKIITGALYAMICLFSSCQIGHVAGQDDSNRDISGIYVFNQFDSKYEILESDTLELEKNGSYCLHTFMKHHDLSNMEVFPTIGAWKINGNTIILNSIFPCDNDSCFIKEIESDKSDEDLIVIEMILLSTGKPLKDYTVI